jgi:DNA-binding NtrC family response regulator
MGVSVGAWILIVEDEEKVAFFLKEGLSGLENGFKVVSAPSAEEALAVITSQDFDLVIVDFRLPGRNGLELISELHASHPHTRTILITAYGSDELEAAAYRRNVCRYFAKPFRLDEFVEAVQEILTSPDPVV